MTIRSVLFLGWNPATRAPLLLGLLLVLVLVAPGWSLSWSLSRLLLLGLLSDGLSSPSSYNAETWSLSRWSWSVSGWEEKNLAAKGLFDMYHLPAAVSSQTRRRAE